MYLYFITFITIIITILIFSCARKKQKVEDLMAKPTFSEPVQVKNAGVSSRRNKNTNRETPKVEHTISIKLDNNNADEDDLKGPKESLSREGVEAPIEQKNKFKKNKAPPSSDFKDDNDKKLKTPPTDKDNPFNNDQPKSKSLSQKQQQNNQKQKKNDKTVELDQTQEVPDKQSDNDEALEAGGGGSKTPKSGKKKTKGKVPESKRVSVLSIKSSRPNLPNRPTRPTPNNKSLKTNDLEPTQEISAG